MRAVDSLLVIKYPRVIYWTVIEDVDLEPAEPAFPDYFAFPFDDFQLQAIAEIRRGRSVMVAAPTSSGKTVVAEYALWRALEAGARAIYTTPIKALSNQKRNDLEILFPGRVGLLTGDRSENASAPIIVMTTEVLRNMLVEDPGSLDRVASVVFDEVHYLADPDRGTVWEEAIITCPQHIQLVCLSATIANAEEIASWVSETHRDIALVRHDERPVPLEHFYFTQGRLHLVRDEAGERRAMFPREERLPSPHPSGVVEALAESALLPAIWFAFSRQGAEDAAGMCVRSAPERSRSQREEIERDISWTLAALPPEDRKLPQLSALTQMLRRGVGFHHAGLLPSLKELVERLFTRGLLSVVCATDTLAIGINMPARTVVISNLARPVGGLLSPNDFSQLTGRAGRRGIDARGAVVMLPFRSYRFEDAYKQVGGPLRPVESAFRLRYSTLLSVVEGSEERLVHLVRSSLRQYQLKAAGERAVQRLAELRLLVSPDDPELIEYLALTSELSAAEKEQKRARNARNKAPKSQPAIRRAERAKRTSARLLLQVRRHERHGEALELENSDPEKIALLREWSAVHAQVDRASRERDEEAVRTAAAVRAVLSQLGYVNRHGLTAKSKGLREMVSSPGIVISELYHSGAFRGLDAAGLAEVLGWFASDSRRRHTNEYRLPKRLERLRDESERIFRRIERIERTEGIELAQGPSEWFYGVVLAWCKGASIADITEQVDMGEGDIVGLLNKTVDQLDQFRSMAMKYRDEDMVALADRAHRLLVRGLVAMVRTADVDTVPPVENVPVTMRAGRAGGS